MPASDKVAQAGQQFPIPATPMKPPPARRPQELPAWLRLSLAARQQADLEFLAKWLESVKIQELRSIADKRGWSIKGTRKADLVQQLIERMTDPAEVARAIAGLEAEHARVFRAMVLLGGDKALQAADLERVARQWGNLSKYKQISTYTGHLWELGLAAPGQAAFGQVDFVPTAIIRHSPPLLQDIVPTLADLSTDRPASDLSLADPLTFIQQVQQLILMLEQQPVELPPPMPQPELAKFYPVLQHWDYDPYEVAGLNPGKLSGYTQQTLTVPPPGPVLPPEARQRLAPVVGGPARLDFMFSLLVAAGLFLPGSPVTIWPEVKEQFFKRDVLAQRAILTRAYFGLTNWSELWAVLRQQPDLRLRRSLLFANYQPAHLWTELAGFRHTVLRVLASLPDDQWLCVDDLKPLLRAVWPRFDQLRWLPPYYYTVRHNPGWYLTRGEVDKPLDPDSEADWLLAQWNFILAMLTGPLAWLGLSDVLYDNDRPLEIRLHGLADLYWDRLEAPEAPHALQSQAAAITPAAAISFDQDRISLNPAAVSAQVHNLLDKIARLDDVLPDRFVYTLDPRAAQVAFEEGETLAGLLAEWERLLPATMSEHIQRQLAAWWQGYGQVRIYDNVTVIEFSDDYALAEMKAATSLAERLIAEISPRLVLIAEADVAPLVAELENAGYMPKQTHQV